MLVAHYPLQEDSGSTAYDATGNGNDGTVNGATLNATGILGTSAYSFDGTDDYVGLPNLVNPSGRSAVTLSAWFYTNSTKDAGIYMSDAGSSTDADLLFSLTSGGNLRWYTFNGTVHGFNGVSSYSTGTWIHLAGVFDSNDGYTLYKNGVEVASSTDTTFVTNSAGDNIGARQNISLGYFDGDIADVRVYDHALTASEVQYLYETTTYAYQTTEAKTL